MQLKRIYAWLFTFCLAIYTVYALLDTFVITRVYAAVEQETEAQIATQMEMPGTTAASVKKGRGSGRQSDRTEKTDTGMSSAGKTEAESSYKSDGIQILLSEYREYDSAIYVADIQLSDPDALKTAFARNSYGRNVTAATSDTAEAVGAVLAVNGDNYGSRQKGYVIRNGVLYRDTAAKDQEDLAIYADGRFEIINESEITAQELLENGAVQVFSFGPGLIEDGTITVDLEDEVDRARASNPRTAIGIIEEGHYVLVVSDGRTDESEGLTLYELAEFMKELGVQTAYNLDGGGSSTMVFQGTVVNETTNGRNDGERAVTDIIYF